MSQELLILEVDKIAARKRIEELNAEIQALGPRFYEVFNQSSETWHDNAPFEAVRDHQSLLAAELDTLKQVLRNCLPSIPKQKKGVVGIGSKIQIRNLKSKKSTLYFIAGDWTLQAGQTVDGAIIMSRKSPLALTLINKKVGDEVHFNYSFIIESIG